MWVYFMFSHDQAHVCLFLAGIVRKCQCILPIAWSRENSACQCVPLTTGDVNYFLVFWSLTNTVNTTGTITSQYVGIHLSGGLLRLMSCFLEFFVRLFISFSVYIFQFSISSEKANNCSAVTGWISGKRIWNTLRLGGDQLEGWWVPHLWMERVCSGPRAHQSCRWTWRVDLTPPPCHTHTLTSPSFASCVTAACHPACTSGFYTSVPVQVDEKGRDWCLLSSCYDLCTLMMRNEKLSHQEVEVSRKS